MIKLLCVTVVGALFISGGPTFTTSKATLFYSGSAYQADDSTGYEVATPKTAAKATVAAQEPEGSEHCKRPTKDNPEEGCKCVYKCVNGEPQEDNSDPEKRCHNFCKKDQCECEKPSCKS